MPTVAKSAKADHSDALFVQTYQLPAAIDPQIVAGMATDHDLDVVALTEMVITILGREADLAAFANRLEQLARLCR